MAISASFTVTQGADRTKVTIKDTTPYDDVETRASFSTRNLVIYKADGTLLKGGTIAFGYADFTNDEIVIDALDKDYALSILMTISPVVSQSGSIYTANIKTALTGHTMTAFLERMKLQRLNPRLEKNDRYVNDTHRILMESENAVKAASANDLSASQQSLDRAAQIITNPLPY